LLYGVLALLFFSGAAWAYWNILVSSPGDFKMDAKAWAMKVHGAAAMAILVLIGMLLTGHVRFAWRARRNRGNGSLFLGTFGILTITGYGLYYAGGESLRALDELDSSSCRIGAAGTLTASHLALGRGQDQRLTVKNIPVQWRN
jgi:hypothetical protein